MPIYEYECIQCHHHFDVLQKIHDAPIKTCPQCAKDSVQRLVSAAGFQLKGTGWYVTDFKNNNKSAPTDSKQNASDNKTNTGTESSKTSSDKTESPQPAKSSEK